MAESATGGGGGSGGPTTSPDAPSSPHAATPAKANVTNDQRALRIGELRIGRHQLGTKGDARITKKGPESSGPLPAGVLPIPGQRVPVPRNSQLAYPHEIHRTSTPSAAFPLSRISIFPESVPGHVDS